MPDSPATSAAVPPPPPRLPWSARTMLTCGALLIALFASGANACLYSHGQLPFKPRDFTLGMSAVCLLLVWSQRPRFNLVSAALLLIPFLRLVDASMLQRFVSQANGGQAPLVALLLSVFLVCVVIVCLLATEVGIVAVRRAAIAVVVVLAGSVLYESLGFATYTAIPGRAAGFLQQPNETTIVMTLMLGVALTLMESFWASAGLIGIAAAGIGCTLSRSGMLVLGLLIICWGLANLRQHFAKMLLIAGLSVPLAALGVAWLIKSAESRNFGTDANAVARVKAIFGGDVSKMESSERKKDLSDGWEAVQKSPLVGYGTGCSSNHWQPHNQWVGVWLDLGIAGALIYAATLIGLTAASVLAGGRGMYCLLPLWLLSVFSQNLTENTAYWCAAAVVATLTTKGKFRITIGRSRGGGAASPAEGAA